MSGEALCCVLSTVSVLRVSRVLGEGVGEGEEVEVPGDDRSLPVADLCTLRILPYFLRIKNEVPEIRF